MEDQTNWLTCLQSILCNNLGKCLFKNTSNYFLLIFFKFIVRKYLLIDLRCLLASVYNNGRKESRNTPTRFNELKRIISEGCLSDYGKNPGGLYYKLWSSMI